MGKVTLLDGGMGQELLRRSERPVTPMWSADIMLNEPILVRDLHRDFIASGARVITLNTYTATPQRLQREKQLAQLEKLHELAMQAAKDAVILSASDPVEIAGCLPPLIASYRPEVALSYQQSLTTYRQLVALQSSGSDLFICETMSSITEALAASTAAKESGKPVWVALTVSDKHPQTLRSGEPLSDALSALCRVDVDAILLNCSQPESINASWPLLINQPQNIGAYANGFISVDSLYPGDTVEDLASRKDLNPKQYAAHGMNWANNGASIIGGCCEIGPAHIEELHNQLSKAGFV